MATPRHSNRLFRSLTVLVLVAITFGAFPIASSAAPRPPAPRTSADAREQLSKLSEDAEVVAEQYNDARVTLKQRKKEYLVADRQAQKV